MPLDFPEVNPNPIIGGGLPGGPGTAYPLSQPFNAPRGINQGGPPGLEFLPQVPQFHAPGYTPPPAFAAPTAADMTQDPSYQFRLQQGLGALGNQAAAQGTWSTGATGKAMMDYAQQAASQEYANIYNRNLNTYNTNYQTQYQQPWQIAMQSRQAEFAPQMTQYNTLAQAGMAQQQQNWENMYRYWQDQFNQGYGQAALGQQGAAL